MEFLIKEARAEERKKYMSEYCKKNYETKLKNTKVMCEVCEKEYVISNKWKHNSSKFHIFFQELIKSRGLKPKESENDLNN
jgi:hypothetical protein